MKKCASLPLLALTTTSAVFSQISAAHAETEINSTTSYVHHNQYYCRIATVNGLRPNPIGVDHFRLHDIHRGIADLYGDGSIEMIFGASDETFSQERAHRPPVWPGWVFAGNEQRSRQPYQHAFYSPQDNFELPNGTRYIGARAIVTQDFNGDDIDDLAIALWGTDYAPFVPFRNEILLSSEDGYQAHYLPGPALHAHGATAGDIDNDGDVDLLIAEGPSSFTHSRVFVLENDGEGNFSRRGTSLAEKSGTISLYDVDGDGNLDLFLIDSSENVGVIEVHWGRGDGYFDPEYVRLFDQSWVSTESYTRGEEDIYERFRHRGFQEPAFADTDGDGLLNVIIPSNQDFHFSLFDLEFDGREVESFEEAFRSEDAPNSGMIPTLNWINACNLSGPTPDMVFEVFGQPYLGNSAPGALLDFSRTERVVFRNDGQGSFEMFKLESPIFFATSLQGLLRGYAEYLGVASGGYEPAQVYYPNTFDGAERFFHPAYVSQRQGDQTLPFNTVPEITESLGYRAINGGNSAVPTGESIPEWSYVSPVSDRVRCILAERTGQDIEGCFEGQVVRAAPAAPGGTQTPARSWSEVSPVSDRVRCILAQRTGQDIEGCFEGQVVQAAPAAPAGTQTQARSWSDVSPISDRVRCILAERTGEEADGC